MNRPICFYIKNGIFFIPKFWITKVIVTKEDVKKYLPDILGRALARVWIDSTFNKLFSQSPQHALERHGVFLPENVIIEFQKPDSDRPRVVVYQQNQGSKFKLRLFYLQLVMMAGR